MRSVASGRGVFVALMLFFMSSAWVYGQVQLREPWIEPSTIAASQPFALTLHFEQDQCSFDYPKVWASVDLSTKVITLLYARTETARVCNTSSTAGPQFLLEGLPAGSYAIEYGSGPECAVPSAGSAPLCKFYIQRQTLSQKLVVRDMVEGEVQYWFAPSVVPAGENFVLDLYDDAAQCNQLFAYKSVSVDTQAKALYLSFSRVLTRMACSGQMKGQSFEISALEAGRYSVYVVDMPACLIPQEPGGEVCAIKIMPQKLEQTLEVEAGGGELAVWFKPDTVEADSAFSLQLHFGEDQCRHGYRNMSVQVDTLRKSLYLSYVAMGEVLDRYCLLPMSEGPLFEVGKLGAGVYSVFYTAWPSCAIPINPTDPVCMIYAEPVLIVKPLVVKERGTVGAQPIAKLSGGGAGVQVVGSVLRIESAEPYGSAVVTLFDVRGRRVVQRSLRSESVLTLSTLSLRGGTYLAVAQLDNGVQLRHRFLVH